MRTSRPRRVRPGIAIVWCCLLSGSVWPQATYYVDDDAPSDPGPGDSTISDPSEDGSSDHPFDAIQEAIDASADGDTVDLRNGIYRGSGNVELGFSGKAILVRREPAASIAMIDARGEGTDPGSVAFYFGEETGAVLEGITVVGGWPAGIRVSSAPTIRDCKLWGNEVGLIVEGGSPLIEGCEFHQNRGYGLVLDQGSAFVRDCDFRGNGGPGIGAGSDSSVVEGCLFDANEGGGLALFATSTVFRDCIIHGHQLELALGGAGAVSFHGAPVFESCEFLDNGVDAFGGGLLVVGGRPIVRRSYFHDNSAQNGGAVAIIDGGEVEVTDSVFQYNEADVKGGAFYSEGLGGLIRNCTLRDNSAAQGGLEIHVAGPALRVEQSIVWRDGYDDFETLVSGNIQAAYSNLENLPASVGGIGNFSADPKFDLNDSKPRLLPESPCANAGDPVFVSPEDAVDFAGESRVKQCRVDVGAFESDGFSDDCDGDAVSDACQIASGLAEDCDLDGHLDACELDMPAIMFHDSFNAGYLEVKKWLAATFENEQGVYASTPPFAPYGIRLQGPFVLESPPVDLFGAKAAKLSLAAAGFSEFSSPLRLDFWDGSAWRPFHVRAAQPFGTPPNLLRTDVFLPRQAMHSAFRFRMRVEPEFQFDSLEWILDDVLLAREESDCDENGVIDVCDAASQEFPDCNANGRHDACELAEAILGRSALLDVGAHPEALTAADFDRDGDVDVVVARGSFVSPGVLVTMQNTGSGVFKKHSERSVQNWPRGVIQADVDGDGWPDVVTVHTYGNSMAVHRNLGGVWWGFAAPIYYPMAEQPQALAAGDLDRDGDVDLLVAAGVVLGPEGTAVAMLNDGSGQFTEGPTLPVGSTPRSVVLADFDGDGWEDAVVVNQYVGDLTLALNGAQSPWSGFDPPEEVIPGSLTRQPFHAVVGDFNRDGAPDLAVVASQQDPTYAIGLLLNAGVGEDPWQKFEEPQLVPVPMFPSALSAGDFNGDGWPDLAVTHVEFSPIENDGKVAIVLNLGDGEMGKWLGMQLDETYLSGAYPMGIAAADFDDDRSLDVVVANRALNFNGSPRGTSGVAVFLQAPRSGFDCNGNAVPDACDVQAEPMTDVDADGVPDECQPDCNGNAVPDALDLTAGLAVDCNNNGRLDSCEIAGGLRDCDQNGTPDECELPGVFSYTSSPLSPVVDAIPQQFTVVSPPAAAGDVSIHVAAHLGLDTGDEMELHLGELLVGRLERPPGRFCPTTGEDLLDFVLAASEFNGTVAGGDAIFHATTSTILGCTPNTASESYLIITLTYPTDPGTDADGNGVLDVCIPGDADLDGDVDRDDALLLPPCVSGPAGTFLAGCFAFDGDLDGDVDLRDAAGFLAGSGF